MTILPANGQQNSGAFLWTDTGTYDGNPIRPLAIDEAIATSMGQEGALPLIHLWVCERALFLGRRDAKLPHLDRVLHTFGKAGYRALLRSSGGACVPLDSGVLNLAIHLPGTSLAIDDFFQLAARLLNAGLQRYGEIAIGEVVGSYCVGDYDFSLNGRKIGGMAQRRTRHGSILQLCINAEPDNRGQLMELFYEQAGLQEMTSNKPIPYMDGTTDTSLSAETKRLVTVSELKEQLYAALSAEWQLTPAPLEVTEAEIESARKHLQDKLGLFSYTAQEMADENWIRRQTSWQPHAEDRSRI
ncbi:UNVERIFIED_CONTAM: octanoyl-[GcvH]:protein N-octanoyltransferase [Brevibacillus sp. OAP136]